MAKLELTLSGNFYQLLNGIEDGILNGSMSASLEDSSDFRGGDGPIHLLAITAGGSQALLFKINTWGEESFLDKLRELL